MTMFKGKSAIVNDSRKFARLPVKDDKKLQVYEKFVKLLRIL